MKRFNLVNNVLGWATFAAGIITYWLTLEKSGSFWDCGEFASAAYRLQVCHPAGAPFFLLLGRLFALFATNVDSVNHVWNVATAINLLSGVMSAANIMFVFWIITHLAKKILKPEADGEYSTSSLIAIMGAGLVGAMGMAWSDTFWFSAVEAEVYASSSFFTFLVFWAVLKWENIADEKHADRWLILIGYFVGLAIGIHLLNLLVIPAIVYTYYFRKYEYSRTGFFKATAAGVGLLFFINFVLIPYIPKLGSMFDLFFVNSLGMGFGSGVIVYSILLVGLMAYSIWYTIKTNRPLWNTIALSITFVVIGYSSYAQVIIRSAANPPIDMNDPEDPFNFVSYINREQYGELPLFYGPYYTAKVIDQEVTSVGYRKDTTEGRYVEGEQKIKPIYEASQSTIFPRMHSSRADHVRAYQEWEKIPEGRKPTFGQNVHFFLSYQIGFMYMRYFMWNFVGRQSDEQGNGELTNGNWLSGVGFIDSWHIGPQSNLPASLKMNKGRNTYFFLPLILGILGLIYHYNRNRQDWFLVLMMFFFTGIAIIIYLNFPPLQPRERDYAYVGSFQTFFIWVGMGVLYLFELLKNRFNKTAVAVAVSSVSFLAAPVLMVSQNWDDHDRSGRTLAVDFARDYLESCDKNAILFTNGDNDTYPLWYAQNVEGIRTDVRIINLSLLNTDWYTNLLKRKVYDSEPVKMTMTPDKYAQGTRDYVLFNDGKTLGINSEEHQELKAILDFICNDSDPRTKVQVTGGDFLSFYPTKKFKITVDKNAVMKNGIVAAEDSAMVVSEMKWEIDRTTLMKNDLVTLDIVANNLNERPIYFAITTGSEPYLKMEPYFQLCGLTYKVVPIEAGRTDGQTGRINTNVMYNNVMNKFRFGGMENKGTYIDGTSMRQTYNFRNLYARLARALATQGDKERAIKVLDRCMEVMPLENVPLNLYFFQLVEAYYLAGAADKGKMYCEMMVKQAEEQLKFFKQYRGSLRKGVSNEVEENTAIFQYVEDITSRNGQSDYATEVRKRFEALGM